jgi:RHS repeat-associated protein
MMMKNAGHFTRLAIVLVWLFGSPHGRCFCSFEGKPSDQFLFGGTAERNTASQSRYGPFSEVSRAGGPIAKAHLFGLSTKCEDGETHLLYYGYRYYHPGTGRWMSRDPLQEGGGKNLSGFVGNDPVRKCDLLGRVQVIFAGGGVLPLKVDVVPSLTVSDVCHGGPLHFNVSFSADYNDEGNRWMDQAGAWFGYSEGRTPASNFQDYPMRWDVAFTKPLPVCPTGRQSGSMDFAAGESEDGQVISITFDWHYRCDCACKEVEPFRPSYTYFFFPPIKPPPPSRPGRPTGH